MGQFKVITDKYKVIVVDDEKPARETLSYLIDWNETAFEIVGTARHGIEALELFKKLQPDLVITDIRMPVMDGLTLIKEVRKEKGRPKFVILTCHEEFSYAKEAIQLGVTDYLIKDLITPDDLSALLQKVQVELNEAAAGKGKVKPRIYSRHVSDAIEYITTNYKRNIGLNEVAQTLNLHKGYLCRLFKKETGAGIHFFIVNLRIEEAKRLILSTNYKMFEIAEKVGYSNIQQFSVAFKKVTGLTPREFREADSSDE